MFSWQEEHGCQNIVQKQKCSLTCSLFKIATKTCSFLLPTYFDSLYIFMLSFFTE